MSETARTAGPTLDQRRAHHAWEAVQRAKAGKRDDAKKFGSQAKRLPMRIMAAGLGHALAFLRAKGYSPQLLTEIADWVLHKRRSPDARGEAPKDNALIDAIVQGDADLLRRATDETLAYLQWLTRFAEAEGLTDDSASED